MGEIAFQAFWKRDNLSIQSSETNAEATVKPTVLFCALLVSCCVFGQTKSQNPGQTPPPDAVRQPDPVAFEGVQSSLRAGRKDEALVKAQAIVQMYPDNLRANLTTGAVLLELSRPADAIAWFRKAATLEPDDPHVHALLLEACAESGDTKMRDEEIATLRRMHSDGRHPAFSEAHSFMIERIPVGNLSVEAVEYFSPEGKFHFYYRFDVYDTSGRMIEFIALASEDEDQVLFAQAHPKEARAGVRRFSLDRYTQNQQALLGFMDGQPTYDNLRARIMKIVTAETDTGAAPADSK
jgi:tetratricopeptide (TPR) repeat protein